MRTFIFKKLQSVSDWLRLWWISGKRILTAREAACYLKTDVHTIYRLKERYYLPSHKTQKQLLNFKRKEIDDWLKPRRRRDLPATLKKSREQGARGKEQGKDGVKE